MDFNQFCEFLPKLDESFTPKEPEHHSMEGTKPEEEEKKLEEIIKPNEANEEEKDIKGLKEQENTSQNEVKLEELKDIETKSENMDPPQLAYFKDNAIVPSNGVALTPDSRVVKMIQQLNVFFRN